MRYGELMRAASRLALVSVIGGLAAACSGDSSRFSDTPFSNPFSSASADAETPPADRVASAPRGAVRSAPLAPVGAMSRSAGSPRPVNWTATGGTAITVASGDTLPAIANRYGVPASAILTVNGITAGQVTAGRQLTIPVSTTSAPRLAAVAPAPHVVSTAKLASVSPSRPERQADAEPRHIRPGSGQARTASAAPTHTRTAEAEPATTASTPKLHARPGRDAKAERSAPLKVAHAEVAATPAAKVGTVLRSEPLPTRPAKVARAETPAAPKHAKVETARAEPVAAAPVKVAAAPKVPKVAEPTRVASVAPATKPAAETPKAAREVESTGTLPAASVAAPAAPSAEFRWPARGRVISGFGGGGSNEGINIAVPEGTPVKAAEGGTVAYAGSEVKGYGNLVLIRHDNGFVSAYAHNGEIDVKRGQRVTRGQVVAKSGQSGNVTSPQIHFELRKGSTPVDPTPLLASN